MSFRCVTDPPLVPLRSAAPMLWEQPSAISASRGGCPSAVRPAGGGRGTFSPFPKVRGRRASPKSRLPCPIPPCASHQRSLTRPLAPVLRLADISQRSSPSPAAVSRACRVARVVCRGESHAAGDAPRHAANVAPGAGGHAASRRRVRVRCRLSRCRHRIPSRVAAPDRKRPRVARGRTQVVLCNVSVITCKQRETRRRRDATARESSDNDKGSR